MTTTYVSASDDLKNTFHTYWTAYAAAIAGSIPAIRYPGVAEPSPPTNAIWGRFSEQVILSGQTTFRNGQSKRHTVAGLVFIQLFAPIALASGDGLRKLQQLGQMGLKAFAARSLSGNIVFRRPMVKELPNEAAYYRLNIVAEYEYDQSI